MIGRFLVAWLAAQAPIAALVGTRIRPQAASPDDVYPFITYYVVDSTSVSSFRGPSGLATPRVQIEIHSRDYAQCQAIAGLVKGTQSNDGLDGYRGSLAAVTVQCARFQGGRDEYDQPVDGRAYGIHRAVLDFTIWHEE